MSSIEPRTATEPPAAVFAALGDPTRLALVQRLGTGEARSIVQLTDGLGLTRQGVTKHLDVLERAGLVAATRVGRERRFHFEPEALAPAQAYLERIAAQWTDALDRLKVFVEVDEGDAVDEAAGSTPLPES